MVAVGAAPMNANVLVFYLSFSQIVTKISNNFFGLVS